MVAGILFYGSSKNPQLAHSLGRSVGEFKKGRAEIDREIKAEQTRPAIAPGPTGPSPLTRPYRPHGRGELLPRERIAPFPGRGKARWEVRG